MDYAYLRQQIRGLFNSTLVLPIFSAYIGKFEVKLIFIRGPLNPTLALPIIVCTLGKFEVKLIPYLKLLIHFVQVSIGAWIILRSDNKSEVN